MFFIVRNKLFKKLHKKGGTVYFSEGSDFDYKKFLQIHTRRISSCLPASMTVEAAFVLPFFLFAFLNLISIIEIYRLQSNLSAAMHAAVKQMAVYGYEYREISGGDVQAAESLGLTYVYAANKVKTTLGNEYLGNSPMYGDISWIRSKVMVEEDCIDLVATYKIEPFVAVMGYHSRYMYNRMRTRAWTGYDNANAGLHATIAEELVYITPDGEVYHKSRSCTYLKLSIVAVDISFLETMRSKDGAKYYPCESCGSSCGNTVFVTNYGNRYHSTLQCSKIKRTVLAVPISEVGGRGACSKCGG